MLSNSLLIRTIINRWHCGWRVGISTQRSLVQFPPASSYSICDAILSIFVSPESSLRLDSRSFGHLNSTLDTVGKKQSLRLQQSTQQLLTAAFEERTLRSFVSLSFSGRVGVLRATRHSRAHLSRFGALLPDGLDQFPPREILFTIALTLAIRE